MKKLAVILFLFAGAVHAETAQQCVTQHFIQARENPRIKYEQDPQIMTIWCECKTQQTNGGKTLEKAVEHCAGATNEPINQYLQKKK